ncbi:MAG: hypothetical protein IPK72_04890 [Candidatus Eisenbacteria bacterium]|nr:hypothetical protein [Candidatus Eisenbacteria bacterium]
MKFKSVLVFACVVALFVGWLARPATVRAANGAGVVLLHVEAGISPDTPPKRSVMPRPSPRSKAC